MPILESVLLMAGVALAPVAASPAPQAAPRQHRAGAGRHRQRWGHQIRGRWHAGWGAPGGWGGYRFARPGYLLPTYWIQPRYVIIWQPVGLPPPPPGHYWSRYYDDAVMIDGDGRVRESRSGIAWDEPDADGTHAGHGEHRPGHGADYPPPPNADGPPPYPDDYVFDGPPPPNHRAAPHPHHRPAQGGAPVVINGIAYPGGGTFSGGYYHPPATTVTITVQPGSSVTHVIGGPGPHPR